MSGQKLVTNSTLIDTDILIDFGRGVSEAINCLQKLQSNSQVTISVVTQMELIVGCANQLVITDFRKISPTL